MRDIDPEPVLGQTGRAVNSATIWRFGISNKSSAGATACYPSPAPGSTELLREYLRRDRLNPAKTVGKAEKERLEQRSPVGARELFAFLRQLLG